jgi:hypothetical protein
MDEKRTICGCGSPAGATFASDIERTPRFAYLFRRSVAEKLCELVAPVVLASFAVKTALRITAARPLVSDPEKRYT